MPLTTVLDAQSLRFQPLLYPLGIWVLMAVVAVVNGGFREGVLIPRVGEYAAHVLSTALLVAAILLISFVYFRRTPVEYTPVELVVVGVLWTLLTVGFEFLVGCAEGTPVSVTLGQYNVLAGQVWITVPLTLLLSPLLFGWYLVPRDDTDRRTGPGLSVSCQDNTGDECDICRRSLSGEKRQSAPGVAITARSSAGVTASPRTGRPSSARR